MWATRMVSGAWARAGSATFGLSDRRWRAAAGVVGVLLPVALALKNVRPVIFMYALELRVPWVYLGLTTETIVLASLWTLTAVLALAGLQWLGLIGVPLVAFAIAVLIVHRRERTIELLALGRAAQRG